MDEREKLTFARSVAAALRVIGSTPRAQVLGMLAGLEVSPEDGAAVIAYAVARRILVEDGGAIRACDDD